MKSRIYQTDTEEETIALGEKLATEPKAPRRVAGIDKEPPPELEDDGVPAPKRKTALSGA